MSSDGIQRRKKTSNKNRDNTEVLSPETTAPEVVPQRNEQKSIVKRVFTRMALSVAILSMVYFTTKTNSKTELVMASVSETISGSPKGQEVICSKSYNEERLKFTSCAPQRCGRFVSDAVVSQKEAIHLLSLAKRGLSLGGSSGGASILDLHSGALSQNTSFVNIYKLIESKQKQNIFEEKDFEVYKSVKNKILETIAIYFGISSKHLYLTHPTFFSRITTKTAKTVDDEYWQKHIDKHNYRSFVFTSLLYLSTFNEDFSGGRFVFIDNNINKTIAIEPKLGRLSAFTSGSENPHFVEKVTKGTRYAITVSFTCDPKYSIKDPSLTNNSNQKLLKGYRI